MLLAGWASWFFLARVAVYATSSEARLEVAQQVHPVEVEVEGIVEITNMHLGREVENGEILVKLDSKATRLQLDEYGFRLETLSSQLEVLDRELDAERLVLDASQGVSSAALAEARAREREARAMANFAREKAKRWKNLAQDGVVSGVDELEAQAHSKQREREVESLRLGARRIQQERNKNVVEQRALLDRLERERARLRGELATVRATIGRLEHELGRHLIKAPVTGRLGGVTSLRVGAVVAVGERLGAIIPTGEIRAVALFTPAEASGRLHPGQTARIRLDGFPWTQYGSLRARVKTVANEPQGGQMRVELELEPGEDSAIPREHGLPGTAEVEVEKVTPAILVLRAAGRLVSKRPAATAPNTPTEGSP